MLQHVSVNMPQWQGSGFLVAVALAAGCSGLSRVTQLASNTVSIVFRAPAAAQADATSPKTTTTNATSSRYPPFDKVDSTFRPANKAEPPLHRISSLFLFLRTGIALGNQASVLKSSASSVRSDPYPFSPILPRKDREPCHGCQHSKGSTSS